MTLKLPAVNAYADRLSEILGSCVFLNSTQILTLQIIVLIVTQSAIFSFVRQLLGSNFIYFIFLDNCSHKCVVQTNAIGARAVLVSVRKDLTLTSVHLKLDFQLFHDILFLEYCQHFHFFSQLIKLSHPTGIFLMFWHLHLQVNQH